MDRAARRQQILHPVEVSILYSLRHAEAVRFADLMRPTSLTSDSFKFYLHRLVASGWVAKRPGGDYHLTPAGKELANDLDDPARARQKQPKLSVVIIAERRTGGTTEYLLQRRLRQPYFGRWGLLSGPVAWGESFEQAAGRELLKQTGLSASYAVRCFARVADVSPEGALLEDKLFVVVVTSELSGERLQAWPGGEARWLSLTALEAQADYFPETQRLIEAAASGQPYLTITLQQALSDY